METLTRIESKIDALQQPARDTVSIAEIQEIIDRQSWVRTSSAAAAALEINQLHKGKVIE